MSVAYAELFDYAAQAVGLVDCPLCGRTNPSHPRTDRFGFQIGVSQCPCGMGYLNPRMDADGYAEFYRTGYRQLVEQYCGAEAVRLSKDVLSQGRGRSIGRMLAPRTVGRLLDVGGGVGTAAAGVAEQLSVGSITILDPNADELQQAAAKGFRTIHGLIETASLPEQYDLILCLLTSDHWLDPLVALRALRQAVAPEGRLWIDIVDIRARLSLKIDHPLYWTTTSFTDALRRTGWRIEKRYRMPNARGAERPNFLCQGV